jgi:acylpyruvate hydrolase
MRLATVRRDDGTTAAARVEGDQLVLLPFQDVGELLGSGDTWQERAAQPGTAIALADGELGAVVSNPSKIFCVGLNYLAHVREAGAQVDVPEFPALFGKFAEALTGPYDDIALPVDAAGMVDWEAELVVVIGRPVRRATPSEAEAAIAGFTVGNDVSMRDWQFRSPQWLQGKTWEAASPLGPVLVTADEIGLRPDLRITCAVDGQLMQDARTSALIVDPVELVSYVSRIMTLRPGDLIFSGTPEGVGVVRTPPVFLGAGQTMTTEIEGIGRLENRVVDARVEAEPSRDGRSATREGQRA